MGAKSQIWHLANWLGTWQNYFWHPKVPFMPGDGQLPHAHLLHFYRKLPSLSYLPPLHDWQALHVYDMAPTGD